MRWDNPLVLVIAGTVAVHTILLVFVDAMIVTHPIVIKPPAPRIEMFEVKVEPPPVLKPAAAPVQPKAEEPKPEPKPPVKVAPQKVTQPTPPVQEQPKQQPNDQSGGDPVVSMPDIAPGATGVPVNTGKTNTGHVGRGGTGGGTGAGSGSGSADAPPKVEEVSVAMLKKQALPKGDFGYIDAKREYPQQAKQLGIEGDIRVKLSIDATGKVTQATLINRLGHGLDELALAKAKLIQFDPAIDTNNKPVKSTLVWTFKMTLPK